MVEGSVRKGGNKVRISAQLIFAADDKQIWSKRWDRSLEDIFEVQDEVSLDVASLISPALKDQEISKMKNKPKKNISGTRKYSSVDLKNIKLIYDLVKVKGYTLEGAKKQLESSKEIFEVVKKLEKIKSKLINIEKEL